MDDKSLIKKGITNKNYFTVDNCEYWEAIDFEIASGQWFFSIYGLRKKVTSDEENAMIKGMHTDFILQIQWFIQ